MNRHACLISAALLLTMAWATGSAQAPADAESQAQAQARAEARAQAEARRRRQDATPDTRGTGPYPATKETDPSLPDHVVYRPADLEALGNTKLGVYVFGNGGCTDDGASARLHLLEVASHGYLTIAPGAIYNGPGKTDRPPRPAPADPTTAPAATHPEQLTEAIDWALAENARKGSRYFGRVDPDEIAISGYSCGGVQALTLAHDPRVATVVIMNSGLFKDGPTRMAGMLIETKTLLKDLHTPTLYILGGSSDIAYENGMDDFALIDHVPVAVANIDTGHGGTYWEPNGGAAAQVVVAWLDWRLRGNAEAGRVFLGKDCGLCVDPKWAFESKRLDELARD
jgi:hypothetical protein